MTRLDRVLNLLERYDALVAGIFFRHSNRSQKRKRKTNKTTYRARM